MSAKGSVMKSLSEREEFNPRKHTPDSVLGDVCSSSVLSLKFQWKVEF